MACKNSQFLIGLGIGSIVGALVYDFARSSRGQRLKQKVFNTMNRIEGQTGDLLDSAKEKLSTAKERTIRAGEKVVDKVADQTSHVAHNVANNVAKKANNIKDKAHAMADEARK